MDQNNDGIVTVPGQEALVHRYHTLKSAVKELVQGQASLDNSQTLDGLKSFFRSIAARAADGVRRIDLLGRSAHEFIMVIIPDISKDGSRPKLTKDKMLILARERILEMLPVGRYLDERTSITLSGDWVPWFITNVLEKNYGANWETLQLPVGLERETERRLSTEAVQRLRAMITSPDVPEMQKAAARRLLEIGIEQPTVKLGGE